MEDARTDAVRPTEALDMSWTHGLARGSHSLIAIVAAIAVVACSGKVPPTVPPSDAVRPATSDPAPTASTAEPIATSGDAWLVTGRSGEDGLHAILASTGEQLFALPAGVPERDWSHLISAAATGGSTTIRDLRLPELASSSQTIAGTWRLPTVGLDPTPAGVSDDGGTIVLVEDRTVGSQATPPAPSRFAIVDRTSGTTPRVVELAGEFEYDALSPDGSILYVVEHLPGPPDGHYQVRALDTASGVLRDGAVADKNEGDEEMAGWPIAQARRADGMVYTLYRGAEHPFIHALNSNEAWALCIDLPSTEIDDPGATSDWGISVTTDGRSILAVNATIGLAAEISVADLAVRRTRAFEPSASRGVSLAKFGHGAPGAVGRRLLASPSGSVVYAAGRGGIVSIGVADLGLKGRSLEGVAVDAMAVTPDGATLYALVHAGGRIVRLDPASGRIAGEVPGGRFDRLLGIVPY
jgi:hypothetical protein